MVYMQCNLELQSKYTGAYLLVEYLRCFEYLLLGLLEGRVALFVEAKSVFRAAVFGGGGVLAM